ncbi:hypothetical protein [Bacillus sp. SJS]|uniref:hypothetical protein n=1 Tax=Bacillus sp. SJS TaxID=1423321 RepID=UPI0004DCC617|nr:hypothetical protein [Bacillus sp. SJS]KZZ82516.1 hypothetical protein AS29_020710 [Bacillus sp. SJS]
MFNKSLEELMDKAFEKKKKVESLLEGVKREVAAVEDSIQLQNQTLVELEIEEEKSGQDACKKEIRKLIIQKDELNSRMKAYQEQLKRGVLNQKEMDALRKAYSREHELMEEELNGFYSERKETENQIRQLENKAKELQFKIEMLSNKKSGLSKNRNILTCLDPRTERFDFLIKEQILSGWFKGHDMEALIAKEMNKQNPPEVKRDVFVFGEELKIVEQEMIEQNPPEVKRDVFVVGDNRKIGRTRMW